MIAFGIFLSATRDPLLRWRAIVTTPNLPYPRVFPTTKSSIQSFPGFFLRSETSRNLLGGDRLSELSVEVGEAIFLNLSS
jgi:hypothetical protein